MSKSKTNQKGESKKESVPDLTGVFSHTDLFPYLFLRTHVKADRFIEVMTKENVLAAVKGAIDAKELFLIIGGGSNIAFLQDPFHGLIIKNSYKELKILADTEESVHIQVSSGYPMALLVEKSIKHGWEGFEYHKGLPGTVGGAVYMNSKWTRPYSAVGDMLLSAELIDKKGEIRSVDHDYFRFSYDYSILQETKEVVLNVVFRLKKNDSLILQRRAQETLEYRKKTQPMGVATCGCFFRNITEEEKKEHNLPTSSVGYLIDQCGLKGFSIGDFAVSTVHANFIINKGLREGKPADLLQLVELIKDSVKKKFGISLHTEVEVI